MMYSYAESLLDPKNCSSKRVSRACDRCRLKKTKCDGRRCCNRCLADDAICVFSKRKRSSDRPYSSEYVQLLEDQQMKLVEGVQELYRRLKRGERWNGPEIAEDSQGYPLVQDILGSLAVLAPSERGNSRKPMDLAVIDEQDDYDEISTEYATSTRINSASPPLTPPECSQSSGINSPEHDFPLHQYGAVPIPARQQHLNVQTTSIRQNTPLPIQTMHCQPAIPDGVEWWPMNQSFNGVATTTADWSGYTADNIVVAQSNPSWYSGHYMMM